MFQMLKPTLILIYYLAIIAGALQLIDNIFKGDPHTKFMIRYAIVVFIIVLCYNIYKKRKEAKKAAEESNIVTINDEDCPKQDKDNKKL